jgi:voltage-gated potassium channel
MPTEIDSEAARRTQQKLRDAKGFRRAVLQSALRVVVLDAVLVAAYSFAPLGSRLEGHAVAWLSLWAGTLVLLVIGELRYISGSREPEVRAVEALAVGLPVALLPFAATYYILSRATGSNFDQHLSRLDAVYFMVTTFTTVGYGDIAPRSEVARAVVLGQMALDLALIGVFVRLLVGAVRRRRDSLGEPE